MDVQHLHDSVNMIFTVMLLVKTIYVHGHPTIPKNVVESIVIFLNQPSKKNILLLSAALLAVCPLVVAGPIQH